MKKVVGLAAFLSWGSALAHVKPAPHSHVGTFHPEEILLITGLLFGGVFVAYLLRRKSRVSS